MLQSLNLSNMFATAMMAVPDSKEIYSEKDIKDLKKVMSDTESWFMSTWKKQNETSPEKNPVLLTKDVYSYQGKLDREVAYLINKAKYYVPKPKPKNETVSNTTKSTKGNNTTKAEANKTESKTGEEKAETVIPSDNKSEKAEAPEVVLEKEKKRESEEGGKDKPAEEGEKKDSNAEGKTKTEESGTSEKKAPEEKETPKVKDGESELPVDEKSKAHEPVDEL